MNCMITPDQEKAYPSLMAALCARDMYTRGHCDRVHSLSLKMGRALELNDAALDALRISSQLHDIGKIGVRDEVLLKPGKLTLADWEEMKTHSIHGERIIKNTFLSNKDAVGAIVRHHHEAFDGSGYPDGLAGEEIPLSCRILLVVDAYDAITTGRPYRRPKTHNDAMGLLSNEVGSKLDPKIFSVFTEVIAVSSVASPDC